MPKKHHHRSAFKHGNKPFKGASSKVKGGRINRHKLSSTKLNQESRNAKKNKVVQLRKIKMEKLKLLHKRMGTTIPKILAILTISPHVDQQALKTNLLNSCNAGHMINEMGPIQVERKVGKKTFPYILYFCGPDRFDMLDIAKTADMILCVNSPNPEIHVGKQDFDLGFYDEVPELFSLLKAQGIPHIVPLVQGLSRQSPKQQNILSKAYERYFKMEFVDSGKPMSLDSAHEVEKLWRALSTRRHATLEWRHRPYLLAQNLEYQPHGDSGYLSVTGYLRGERALHPNRLVHITGVGEFQIERIEAAPLSRRAKQHQDAEMEDTNLTLLGEPDENQDDLMMVGELDQFATFNDQSIITEEELQSAEQNNGNSALERRKEELKELGMTDYGLAWEELLSDDEDEGDNMAEKADLACEEAFQMPEIPMETQAELIRRQKKEARDEIMWPDEVETPMDQPAEKRFARYRGLASFHKTQWDVKESLPLEYSRIVQVENFSHMVRTLKADEEGVQPNQRVRITLRAVPQSIMQQWGEKSLVILAGLYQHERKVSVMHYNIQRANTYEEPIRRKTELLFQTGFRRFKCRPVWSADSNGSKHLCQMYFQPGANMVASIYGQLEFTPCPTLVFLPDGSPQTSPLGRDMRASTFVGSGQVMSADAYRLQIKRKVLTGYCIRTHKRRAVVRYMFFRPSDIRWFKPVELSTRGGLRGKIEEPVGTHGYMKCFFNDTIKSHDIVCLNLYKRQYPVAPPAIFGSLGADHETMI